MEIPNNKQNLKKEEILANKDEKMSDWSIKSKIIKKAKIKNELEKETRKKKENHKKVIRNA